MRLSVSLPTRYLNVARRYGNDRFQHRPQPCLRSPRDFSIFEETLGPRPGTDSWYIERDIQRNLFVGRIRTIAAESRAAGARRGAEQEQASRASAGRRAWRED